ncbi:MAG: hypothetical protein HY835_02150 [Anaerolineae bacterium]|nr:hypothetical protein [Anaerolineae bacterium]
MAPHNDPALTQMQTLILNWQSRSDPRAAFLECYHMMTGNMLDALEACEFQDGAWVNRLLHRFADYYFTALDAYERQPAQAPAVWQLAHNRAFEPRTPVLQKLLLGVNAHINYDLVLTVDELLEPEWSRLNPAMRRIRYQDYTHVNLIIAQTIDAVQDQILEPDAPILDLFDRLLGPVDEMLISRLVNHWRENVWRNAVDLLETRAQDERIGIVRRVEHDALRIGDLIA